MDPHPAPLRRLISLLTRLPGVGEKTAERLAQYVLSAPEAWVEELSRGLLEARRNVRFCSRCFGLSAADLCPICSDPGRDAAILCVVEQPADLAVLERSGAFRGLYHVLLGAISPLSGIGPENLRVAELIDRVAAGGVREVVIATSTGVEGEATAAYLAGRLASFPVTVTRIASGVPVGGDLKYVDPVTLKKALEARRALG